MPSIVLPGVICNAFPQQAQDDQVAVLRMNTGATQFNHRGVERLEGFQVEFLRTVITQIFRRIVSSLQPVGANDGGRWQMLHDKVIANRVERIFVEAGRVGLLKPLVQFEIENLKTQGLGAADIVGIARQPRGIVRWHTYQ